VRAQFVFLIFDFCLLIFDLYFPMPAIDLLPLSDLNPAHLTGLPEKLARTFRVPCRVRPERLDPSFSLDPRRDQYHSTAILQAM